MRLTKLFPTAGELTAEAATSELEFASRAPRDRPYIVLNMIATLDGRATIDGRSGPIGDAADREIFHGLRTQVDAVMAGAGTIRRERYGRIVPDAARRARRVREGRAPDPVALIVSGSLELPADLPLLADHHSQVIFLTGADSPELLAPSARTDYLRAPREHAKLTLAPLLGRARAEFGVMSVVCEGGPSLNRALLREGLVDELFLTLAPKLAPGDGPTILAGPELGDPTRLDPVSILESEGSLFLRYRVVG